MFKLNFYQLHALIWALFLLIMFSLPGNAIHAMGTAKTNWSFVSFAFHLFGYATMAFLVFNARVHERNAKNAVLYTLLLCFSYGFFTECIQLLIPGRYFLISDIFVNYAGSILGIFAYKFIPAFVTSK